MIPIIAAIGSGIGCVRRAFGVAFNIRKAIKEIKDVIRVSQEMWSKYDDLDDNAKKWAKELMEAVTAIKNVFKI